ncbi:MAG TPA: tetraacyldisaccharide 4'-kinase [Armatimonadota bacterium]|nr:tetraacyldisaccharide 4'-kinase [Armatimonadota bacterium]
MSRGKGPDFDHPLFNALVPLSWLYAAGLKVYLAPYKIGLRKQHKLPCRVVSVGNLTFGGTGKSPTVRALCSKLMERGVRPAVLSRGHGGRLSNVGAIVSDGTKRLLDAVDCGDEPALLADSLPGVPVAIGKDRKKAGWMLIEQFNPDLIMLDDGMQYWQLHRDFEIVLMDAQRPFGSGKVLPAGNLREPVSGLSRADAVVITGMEVFDSDKRWDSPTVLSKLPDGVEVFQARRQPVAVIDCATNERKPVSVLNGLPVVAVSGIANPMSFETMLARCGADIRESVRFGDHCAYSTVEVDIVRRAIAETKAEVVITTVKDAVKLRLSNMYVLDIELNIEDVDRLLELVVRSEVAG